MAHKTLSTKMYDEAIPGGSVMGDLVSIIGESTIQTETGKIVECYLYNIDGYTPKNGKPFIANKANIYLI